MQLSRLITSTDPDHRVAEAYELLKACEVDSPILDLLVGCVEDNIRLLIEALITTDNGSEQLRGRIHALREVSMFRGNLAKYARSVIDHGENA